MKSRMTKAKIPRTLHEMQKTLEAEKTVTASQEADTAHKYDVGLLGADDSARLSLVEFRLPAPGDFSASAMLHDNKTGESKTAIHARYHSVLAMEAARKMRRSKQKLKIGQEVCHHLRMMLASDPVPRESDSINQASSAEPQFRLGL